MQAEGELVKPVLRKVTVRQYREDGALISAGLTAGETIAAAGVHKIIAGQALRPVAPARPAAARSPLSGAQDQAGGTGLHNSVVLNAGSGKNR